MGKNTLFRALSSLLFAVAVASASAGCASNAMQVATEARYQGNRSEMLELVVDTVRATKYEVIQMNPETGLIVTRERWYEKDGTFEDKKLASDDHWISDRAILLRYEVRLRTSGPEYQVEVVPVMLQHRVGYSAPVPLAPDDLAVPGWVHGKTEKLTVAIYDALAKYRVVANDGAKPTIAARND